MNNREKLSSQNKNKQQSGNPAIQKNIYTTQQIGHRTSAVNMPHVRETKYALHKQKENMTVLVKIKSMLPATARAKGRYSTNQNEIECVREKEKHRSEFVIMSKRRGGDVIQLSRTSAGSGWTF